MSHFGDTLVIRKSFYSTISQLAGRSPNFILPLVFLGKFGGSEASDLLFLSLAIVFFWERRCLMLPQMLLFQIFLKVK